MSMMVVNTFSDTKASRVGDLSFNGNIFVVSRVHFIAVTHVSSLVLWKSQH